MGGARKGDEVLREKRSDVEACIEKKKKKTMIVESLAMQNENEKEKQRSRNETKESR